MRFMIIIFCLINGLLTGMEEKSLKTPKLPRRNGIRAHQLKNKNQIIRLSKSSTNKTKTVCTDQSEQMILQEKAKEEEEEKEYEEREKK